MLLTEKEEEIQWASSDIVSVIASMPALSYEENMSISTFAEKKRPIIPSLSFPIDNNGDAIDENAPELARLIGEVRTEKPGFGGKIHASDLLSAQFVYAMQNNKRINKQNGAFILYGEPILDFQNGMKTLGIAAPRWSSINNKEGKHAVLCIANKKHIMRELDFLGINEETMFPEIEDVSRAIVKKL